MKKLLFAVFAILGFIACGQKSPAPASKDKPTRQNEPGDSTHYGLVTPSTSFAPTRSDRYTDAHALATNWLSFSIRKTNRRL